MRLSHIWKIDWIAIAKDQILMKLNSLIQFKSKAKLIVKVKFQSNAIWNYKIKTGRGKCKIAKLKTVGWCGLQTQKTRSLDVVKKVTKLGDFMLKFWPRNYSWAAKKQPLPPFPTSPGWGQLLSCFKIVLITFLKVCRNRRASGDN